LSPRPFPLPEDLGIKTAQPGTYLWRCAAAHLLVGANRSGRLTAEGAAKQLFGDDPPTMALIQRAATQPATTATSGWASELTGRSVFDALQQPTSVSAAATLIAHALHIDLSGFAQVVVPGRVVDAASAGAWVRESEPIPVRMLNFSAVTLMPRKLAVIKIFTREMAESSNIEAVVRQTLGEASGLALDAAMFSNTPADPTRPAGLLNGVTPIAAAPAGPTAMNQDLGNLISALAANGAGLAPAIVASPAQAFAIKLMAGAHFDVPVLASAALANRTVVALESSSLVTGFDSTPEFNVSKAGTLHMDDLPRHIVDGGTAAAPTVRSMFQTDSLALRMLLRASWAMRAPGHAAWIQNVNWL
jgi:hypothetical protein